MDKCKVIAGTNQKGGGETTTTVNLGVGLAQQGEKVLLKEFYGGGGKQGSGVKGRSL